LLRVQSLYNFNYVLIYKAKYVDPHTKLRYASADEYAQIKTLPSDIITGLLQLRRASNVVG